MILELGFILALFCGSTLGIQGDDMSDEDFAEYLEFHKDVGISASQYGESAARGCVKGVTASTIRGSGFKELCINCAVNAASEVVADFALSKKKE